MENEEKDLTDDFFDIQNEEEEPPVRESDLEARIRYAEK